jgi:hypothetical protein
MLLISSLLLFPFTALSDLATTTFCLVVRVIDVVPMVCHVKRPTSQRNAMPRARRTQGVKSPPRSTASCSGGAKRNWAICLSCPATYLTIRTHTSNATSATSRTTATRNAI